MRFPNPLPLALLFAPLFACEDDDTGIDDTDVSETGDTGAVVDCAGAEAYTPPDVIDAPETWSCLVQVGADLRIQDVVTVEPGTVIEFSDRIFVQEGGRIESIGTAEEPVTWTSPNGVPAAGDWRYFDFNDTADNGNVFEHTIIEYGGDANQMMYFGGAVGVSFRDVTVRHSLALALDLTDADVQEFSRVTFAEIPNHPMVMHPSDLHAISEIDVGPTVQDENILVVDGGSRGVLTTDSSWPAQTVPYEIVGDFDVQAEVDVDPGTVIDIREDSRMFVQGGGVLRTHGEAGNEVIIQSAAPTPAAGDWIYWDYKSDAGTGNAFTHTIIRHGGNNVGFGALTIADGITVTLDNVVFEDNLDCDVYDDGAVPTTNTTYDSCIDRAHRS